MRRFDFCRGHLTDKVNDMHAQGYRLHAALEQNGNTVLIFEHRAA